MTPSNFPFSEIRDQSDGDSVRFRNDGISDEEEIENDNDAENSVEGKTYINNLLEASSSEEEGALENLKSKMNEDEEDYFEL